MGRVIHLLCGPACSGKSTFVQQQLLGRYPASEQPLVISHDACLAAELPRFKLRYHQAFEQPSDPQLRRQIARLRQAASQRIEALFARARQMSSGAVVIDLTNLLPETRQHSLRSVGVRTADRVLAYNFIVSDKSQWLALAARRGEQSDKRISPAVLERQWQDFYLADRFEPWISQVVTRETDWIGAALSDTKPAQAD